jgi:hypothetical protein
MEISDEMVDAAARKICAEWGYDWGADPDTDNQGAPEMPGDWDDRPSKLLYRMAARAALEDVAPAIRAAAMEEAAKIAEGPEYRHNGNGEVILRGTDSGNWCVPTTDFPRVGGYGQGRVDAAAAIRAAKDGEVMCCGNCRYFQPQTTATTGPYFGNDPGFCYLHPARVCAANYCDRHSPTRAAKETT